MVVAIGADRAESPVRAMAMRSGQLSAAGFASGAGSVDRQADEIGLHDQVGFRGIGRRVPRWSCLAPFVREVGDALDAHAVAATL